MGGVGGQDQIHLEIRTTRSAAMAAENRLSSNIIFIGKIELPKLI